MMPGDICLGKFPLGGTPGVKVRPVLVLTGPLGPVPEYMTAYISSVIPNPLLPGDVVIDPTQPEYAATNLKQTSVIRLHKLATVHSRDLVRQLGALPPAAFTQVKSLLRTILDL